MAKITASGLAKNENAGNGLRIYVVSQDGAIRPANRKDANKRCVTTVRGSVAVEGTRLYRVTVGMGEMLVQGSQWFDLVELSEPDNADEKPQPETETYTPVAVPAIVSTPDVDTYASTVGQQNDKLVARVAELEDEVRGLLDRIAELITKVNRQGFSIVADQVGMLHACYEDKPTVECESELRTVSVVATGVQAMHPGRKVCPKCERKIRESAA